MRDSDVCIIDSEVETPKFQKQKSFKRAKISFEDNLLKMLENRKVEDPVSSFLMSLAPQIRSLSQDKQNQIFIDFLQTIQRVSSSNPNQNTYIPPLTNNINSWPIQQSTATFYDRSYNAYPTVINHRPNHTSLTPASSTLTSPVPNASQSMSDIPQHFYSNTNSSQTTSPCSPSFNYSSMYNNTYESDNTK